MTIISFTSGTSAQAGEVNSNFDNVTVYRTASTALASTEVFLTNTSFDDLNISDKIKNLDFRSIKFSSNIPYQIYTLFFILSLFFILDNYPSIIL